MMEKGCLLLGTILFLIVVSESRVIVPRALAKDGFPPGNGQMPFTINALKKDNELGLKSLIWGPPTVDDNFNNDDDAGFNGPSGGPSDYDYNKPGRSVNAIANLPGTEPERFPLEADRDEKPEGNPIDYYDIDKSGDENLGKPLDGEDKFVGDDKGLEFAPGEEKPTDKDRDESDIGYDPEDNIDKGEKSDDEEKSGEERKDEEEYNPENDEKLGDEKKDEEEYKPDDEEKLDEEKKAEEESKPEDEENPDEEKIDQEEEHKPENEEKPDEDKKDQEEHKPEGEEKPDEERRDEEEKHKSEDDDENKYIPEKPIDDETKEEMPKETDEESIGHEDENNTKEGALEGGEADEDAIFDNPFFNLEQVKKYFSQLERALGHVFQQTLDEARLLNGTYANTTEEEVDIDGKKYIITKSIISGSDNDSSLYVESLSSRSKINETKAFT